MKKFNLSRCFKLCFLLAVFFQIDIAYAIDMAITVDDLPVHGNLPPGVKREDIGEQMINAFKKHHITGVYGFVIGDTVIDKKKWFLMRQIEDVYNFVAGKKTDDWNVLQKWVNSGHLLGNHTFSHLDLAKVSADEYIKDIKKNEKILAEWMGNKNYKYFRYPYLSEGDTLKKRNRVREFLFKNHYQIAEVTVGFSDHKWNLAYVRCALKHDETSIKWLKKSFIEQALNGVQISHLFSKMLFHRDVKNVLLLHFGPFEAMMMDDLLSAYEKQGIRFISLPEALSDEVYNINPNVAYKLGLAFLPQIRIARYLSTPAKVSQLTATLPEKKLDSLCQS